MQKLNVVLVAILIMLGFVAADASAQKPDYLTTGEPDQPQMAEVGSIRGQIRIAGEESDPVSGAQIEWVSDDGQHGKVRSDRKGRYVIQNLRPGEYVLNASRDRMGQHYVNVSVHAGNESVFDISLRGDDTSDGDLVEIIRRDESDPPQAATRRELEQLRRKLRETEPDSQGRQELQRRVDELNKMIRSDRTDVGKRRGQQPKIEQPQMGRQPQPSPRAARSRVELRVYALEHVPVEHAAKIVDALVGREPIVVPDSWSGKLFVKAQTQHLREIEEILHHLDVPPRQHPAGDMWRRTERGSERRERHEGGKRSPEEREGPIFSITIQASGEEGAEVLFRESPITRDELAERLSHLDEPGSWRLRIHVVDDVPVAILRDVIEDVEEVARAKGIHRLEIEAVQQEGVEGGE